MRAAVYQGKGLPLSIDSVPDPVPAHGQVVIEVRYCGICGSDLHMAEHGFAAPGTVFGHEFAGTIAAIGARDPGGAGGATGAAGTLRVGDRVTALPLYSCGHCELCDADLPGICASTNFVGVSPSASGGYARYVVVAGNKLQALPGDVGFEEGAMVEPLAVAHHAVRLGAVPTGESVLVLGGGPIGLGVALFARHYGAKHVVVSEPAPARRARALELGATAVIDPQGENVAERFQAIAGRPPAVVFECVGNPGLIRQAVDLVRARGTVLVAGVSFADEPIWPITALGKEVRIQFSQCYGERDFAAVIDAIAARRVDPAPMHTRTVKLDEAPAAFASLAKQPEQCKVLIEPTA